MNKDALSKSAGAIGTGIGATIYFLFHDVAITCIVAACIAAAYFFGMEFVTAPFRLIAAIFGF